MIHKTLMAVLQKVGLSDEDEDYDDKAHAKTAAGLALSLLFFCRDLGQLSNGS